MANCKKNQEILFETIATEVFARYGRTWKPQTAKVNRAYLRKKILPWFRGRSIKKISCSEVEKWFATLYETPAAANRSLPILSVIMRQAEIYGYRSDASNPCVGISRYRENSRERFLTNVEMKQLGTALTSHEAVSPSAVSLVRLLVLTGCRQGEVRLLKWPDYREGHLFLRDSKTGPRTVWLSSPAREVLKRIPRTKEWIFPPIKGGGPMPTETLYRCWRIGRKNAGLSDVRLHDLRHNYASFAMRQGETILTVGRLLGHRDPTTTLRYTHMDDPLIIQAAEVVGGTLNTKL